jgi:WD40 repeat protein
MIGILLYGCSSQELIEDVPIENILATVETSDDGLNNSESASSDANSGKSIVLLPSIGSDLMELLTTENFDRLEQVARFGNGYIQDVAVSPDNSTLAVYIGETIHFYDTETFEIKHSIFTRKYYSNSSRRWLEGKILAFSSNSNMILYSNGKQITLFDISENQRLTYFSSLIPDWDVVDISFSPNDDKVIVTTKGTSQRCDGGDMNFALYDLDGKLIFDRYTCSDYWNNQYRFTSDEKVLFTFSSVMTGVYPTQTFLIDLDSGTILEHTHAEYLDYEKPKPNLTLLYDISPDGQLLAYAVYNQAENKLIVQTKLIQFGTNEVVHEQEGLVEFIIDQGEIKWQAVSNDKSARNTEFTICNINKSHQADEYEQILFESERAIFAVIHYGQIESIELWNVPNCEIEKTISFPAVQDAIFSPDGQWLASTDGFHAYVWEVQTSKLHYGVAGIAFESPKDVIQFNTDGSRFLVGSSGRHNFYPDQPYQTYTISIYDTTSGEFVRDLRSESGYLETIIATPEKDLVIVQDSINQSVWNIETGQKITTLPNGPIVFASQAGCIWLVPQEGRYAYASRKIILYNYHTGEFLRELSEISANWIRNIYLDSSGEKLMVHLFLGQGKENGDAIVIFDVENGGKELLSYKLPLKNYKMSAYGNYFATNGSDGYVHLWNYESDTPVLSLWGNRPNRKITDQYKDADNLYGNLVFIDTIFMNENILITMGTSLRFWNTQNGYLLAEMQPDFSIDTMTISPDGALIAVVGKDGVIRLWGVPSQP